jgi:mono/diheme cytochrome c family protein
MAKTRPPDTGDPGAVRTAMNTTAYTGSPMTPRRPMASPLNPRPPGQGSPRDDRHVHRPPALRGEADIGVPGQHCAACHTDNNFPLSVGEASYQSIPGHPRWGLAPIEMAWE